MNAYRQASASIYGMENKEPSEHAVSPEVLRSFVVYDSLTRFVMPFCSGAAGGPDVVHKTLQLVDITGHINELSQCRQYFSLGDNPQFVDSPGICPFLDPTPYCGKVRWSTNHL